ncbi:MAG: hypothetical protein M0D57_03470 [Sphingobacteriales bacterium JAD_PAG50586_3]|nr:MAG: hypothetical protein M0D57_03470 [Sphingobacteriales bacterium JAD_PAG50586_3]
MSVFIKLRNYLREPRLEGIDPDSDELLVLHSKVLYEKPMMRNVFAEFYDTCINLDTKHFNGIGKRVEIGAGVSFLRRSTPR